MILVRQLSAGGIDVLPTAATQAGIDPVLLQMGHELIDGVVIRLGEKRRLDGVVFNDIHEVGRHLAIDLYQLVRILAAVIEILKEDIFESDLVPRLLIEVIQCLHERLYIIGLIDGHDLITLNIIGGMQGKGQFELHLVVTQLMDHFGDASCADGDTAGTHAKPIGGRDTLDGL